MKSRLMPKALKTILQIPGKVQLLIVTKSHPWYVNVPFLPGNDDVLHGRPTQLSTALPIHVAFSLCLFPPLNACFRNENDDRELKQNLLAVRLPSSLAIPFPRFMLRFLSTLLACKESSNILLNLL